MELIKLAEKLVGFDTVSQKSSTRKIADFISNYCEKAGFIVEQYPYQNNKEGLGKVNVVVRKGGEESKLSLSGHMDTVPFNPSDWNTNPLELTEMGDKYYGMGITDMKLFLAIAIKAGEAISEHELKYPFSLCFTSDEEVGCLGARKLIRQNVHIADLIVIGEPTEMIPLNLHKGYMFLRIKLKGKTGHASDPKKGASVVDLALIPVLQKLFEFKNNLAEITDKRFYPPYPTLNIGVVTTDNQESGKKSAKNLIADFCKIELEIRPLPGQDSGELYRVLKQIIIQEISAIKDSDVQIEFGRAPTPPMETNEKSEIAIAVNNVSGEKMQSVCFNTEGGVFNEQGAQTIIWGPGSIHQAHKPREFVDIQYFQPEITYKYIRLIRSICC